MSKNIQFKKIVENVFKEFPEYQPSDGTKGGLDLAYVVIPDLYEYVLDLIETNEKPEVVERFFKFINSYLDVKKPNHDVLNLFEIEIFKLLPESDEAYKLAKEYLSPRVQEWLPSKE